MRRKNGKAKVFIECARCGKKFETYICWVDKGARYCSRKCGSMDTARRGSKHHLWRGKRIAKTGYVMVRENGKDRHEHDVIMEKNIGRKLVAGEVVHHINGDKQDNKIENLKLMPNSEHWSLHLRERWGKSRMIKCTCMECGVMFFRTLSKIKSYPRVFCSNRCHVDNRTANEEG